MQNSFLSHADAALRNRNSLLHYVKYHEPISRTDIWEGMNISRASVTQVIKQLQESNLILETGHGESTGGRRPCYIMFNGAAKKLYAFDWSTQILCLMDLSGTILYEKKMTFDRSIRPAAFAAALLQGIEEISVLQLCPAEEVIGLGLSLPGLIDSRSNSVIYSVELGWQNVSLLDLFSGRFGQNIYLERIGNVMALGEYHYGSAKGSSHFQLFILGSDGIGVSTISHGNCLHGAGYMHGELGHIKLNSDVVCSCGQRGCLEAVVNQRLLSTGGELTDEILEYLAIGVSTAINISDTGTAILVGDLVDRMTSEQKTCLICAIRDKVTGHHLRRLDIRFSHDTKRMALNGISAYVFDRYFAVD